MISIVRYQNVSELQVLPLRDLFIARFFETIAFLLARRSIVGGWRIVSTTGPVKILFHVVPVINWVRLLTAILGRKDPIIQLLRNPKSQLLFIKLRLIFSAGDFWTILFLECQLLVQNSFT